ncbi:MAG: RES family NAD+ phosphorylase [Janthinobacterium lividum]
MAADQPTVDVDAVFYTLIPSRFPTIKLYSRIAHDREDEIAELESMTNPRLREKDRLTNGLGIVDASSPLLQNWNHAPFAYHNPEGSRFFGPESAVLELAADLQTALAVSVRKRETFLARTDQPAIGCEMRVLSRRVNGHFLDLTALGSEVEVDERIRLGQTAMARSMDGLLFRPPERPTGKCIVVTRGDVLARAVQGDHYKFSWAGGRIGNLYSFSSGTEYDPQAICSPGDVLAA